MLRGILWGQSSLKGDFEKFRPAGQTKALVWELETIDVRGIAFAAVVVRFPALYFANISSATLLQALYTISPDAAFERKGKISKFPYLLYYNFFLCILSLRNGTPAGKRLVELYDKGVIPKASTKAEPEKQVAPQTKRWILECVQQEQRDRDEALAEKRRGQDIWGEMEEQPNLEEPRRASGSANEGVQRNDIKTGLRGRALTDHTDDEQRSPIDMNKTSDRDVTEGDHDSGERLRQDDLDISQPIAVGPELGEDDDDELSKALYGNKRRRVDSPPRDQLKVTSQIKQVTFRRYLDFEASPVTCVKTL